MAHNIPVSDNHVNRDLKISKTFLKLFQAWKKSFKEIHLFNT